MGHICVAIAIEDARVSAGGMLGSLKFHITDDDNRVPPTYLQQQTSGTRVPLCVAAQTARCVPCECPVVASLRA
ncbi:MAG: hypothetical protein RLZZ450_5653 [Pseudomonadota bacterium]|jgi:hypothetical protein